MTSSHPLLLDCTLRDGGYYNRWDFAPEVIAEYLLAMDAAGVDMVEIGMRSLKNDGFKGACAYSTDSFLRTLSIPPSITLGVMINAAEILQNDQLHIATLEALFPETTQTSPVRLVRVACRVNEFSAALPASHWLKERGFAVGFNLMQVADRSDEEIRTLAEEACRYPLDALYFADSMGSLNPTQVAGIVASFRTHWKGAMGIHTHDNMGLALANTLRALEEGVAWLDATVTGMGRGPGNTKTEYLALELAARREKSCNIVPLMRLVRRVFHPLQHACGWGTNSYYYLAGKYGIHPSFIQEMLGDSRYSEEDILAVIDHLRASGGKNFSLRKLDSARHFYQGTPRGSWNPETRFAGREVLLLGTGSGVASYKEALESYIRRHAPLVLALNTQNALEAGLIDLRAACHPVRLLADCATHCALSEPLITPASMLPEHVREALKEKTLLDYGIEVSPNGFAFGATHCSAPTSLVLAYALAIATSGKASKVLLAGFDGYGADDPRNEEMNRLIAAYREHPEALPLVAVTPTRYQLTQESIYGYC